MVLRSDVASIVIITKDGAEIEYYDFSVSETNTHIPAEKVKDNKPMRYLTAIIHLDPDPTLEKGH